MSENKSSKNIFWSSFLKIGRKMLSSTVEITKFGLAGLSFASYAILYNWRFALLVIIAIGFHECGHVWAMKKAGIKTKGFYFIPFLGGVTIPEEKYTSYKQNVWVSIMGPIWGCILSIITAKIYFLTQNPLFAAAAIWMAALNLFNLLPIVPLDGGHIIRAIAFSINQKIGLAFLTLSFLVSAAIMATLHIGLWILILIVGGIELIYEAYLRQNAKTDEHTSWISVELIDHYPAPLKFNQLLITVFSYTIVTMLLIKVIIVMSAIPGSNVTHMFLE